MSCFLKDSTSYSNPLVTLKTFGQSLGLKTNDQKTEALALRNNRTLWEGHSVLPNLFNTIKNLGVYFRYDAKQRDELNFSIKKMINLWKWEVLSHLGKTHIIKTFAIPNLMFRA